MDVDTEMFATNMYALVCGNTKTNTDEFNSCDKESISGPDNVAYVLGHDGLVVGVLHSVHVPALVQACPAACGPVCYTAMHPVVT
jgi:hypothetical protein